MTLNVPDEDWEFMCKYRFFTQNPSEEDIQAEFVTGTGITKNKPHMWNEAGKRFSEYVDNLRDIQKMDFISSEATERPIRTWAELMPG